MRLHYGLFFLMVVSLLASAEARGEAPAAGAIVEIADGVIHPGEVFTVLTYAAPRAVRLGDTGLREAGLTAGAFPRVADEIRIFTSREVSESAPLARIWINERQEGAYWFLTGGEGDAADFVIPEGAMVVIWTRAAKNPVTWQNAFE
ncbi:MAG TPA: hypothetical protein PKA51_12935 [Kiritimatiellia bacterium]|nr:hypothetical protein [Kiritimatiellia bacterium]